MNDDERIERALKSIGDDYVRQNPADFPAFRAGVMRRQRRRRMFQGVGAVALAGATVAIGLFFSRSSAPLGRPEPPAGRGIQRAITESIEVGALPSQVNVGRGAIWVTSKSGSVTRIDAATQEPTRFDVDGLPTDLAVGGSGVWVANFGQLQRLPLEGAGDIEEYPVADGSARMHVSVSPGAVWVVVTGEEIFKVDPESGDLDGGWGSQNPVDIAVADGRLWVLDQTGVIQAFDTKTNEPIGNSIGVSTGTNAEITLGGDALWFGAKGTPTFMRIDIGSGGTRTIRLPSDYVDMGVGHDEVWVLMEGTDETGSFVEVDSATGRLGANPVYAVPGAPVDIAVGNQALWIVNATGNQALRVQKDLLSD